MMMVTMRTMMAMISAYDGKIGQNSAIKIICQDKNGTIELDEFLNMMATRFIMM